MLDFKELLQRAKWGGTVLAEGQKPLTQAEIDAVAAELGKPESRADHYILILILGRAEAVQYRELVESFLDCEEDPMLARAALQVLCDDWEMAADYLPVVKAFIEGVAWDDEGQVRLIAISEAGEYLRKQHDRDLLELLMRVFADPEDDPIDRRAAYSAIGRAVGRGWDELPSAAREIDFDADVDPQVLEEAESLLGRSAG